MKRLSLFIALLLSALAIVQAQAEHWQLAKEENGIRVYLSDEPGSQYKSFRGVTRVKADVASLGHLQENLRVSCAWLYACAQMRLLRYSARQSGSTSTPNSPGPPRPVTWCCKSPPRKPRTAA